MQLVIIYSAGCNSNCNFGIACASLCNLMCNFPAPASQMYRFRCISSSIFDTFGLFWPIPDCPKYKNAPSRAPLSTQTSKLVLQCRPKRHHHQDPPRRFVVFCWVCGYCWCCNANRVCAFVRFLVTHICLDTYPSLVPNVFLRGEHTPGPGGQR